MHRLHKEAASVQRVEQIHASAKGVLIHKKNTVMLINNRHGAYDSK